MQKKCPAFSSATAMIRRIRSIACAVTNVADGMETKSISHNEVFSLAQQLPKRLTALLERSSRGLPLNSKHGKSHSHE